MNDSVSVIIPVLNEEETIEGCLSCLLNQTEKPLEIIVVNNGSTDRTYKIVNRLKNKFKKEKINLRPFYYPYGNETNAREFGTKKAKGAIIGSLDADAHAKNDFVKNVKKHFRNKKIVGLVGKAYFRNKGIFFNFFYSNYTYIRALIGLKCINGGYGAFRKSAFISIKGYKGLEKLRKKENILFAKDDFFLSKKLEKMGKLKICPDVRVSLLQRIRINGDYKKEISLVDSIRKAILGYIYDKRIKKYFKNNNN